MKKSKDTKVKYNKDNFLSILSTLSIEEVNTIIREKGKEPKLIVPFVFIEE